MIDTHQLTQLLVSCWVLASKEERGKLRIPTSHGVLDHALQALTEDDQLPGWVRDSLNFADGRTGLVCLELPDILAWAQHAKLTQEPNPSYRYTEVLVDREFAKQRLRRLGIDEGEARRWGEILRRRADEWQATLNKSSLSPSLG